MRLTSSPDSTLTYRVSSGRAGYRRRPHRARDRLARVSAPLAGDVAQTLGLSVTNPTSRTIRGPISVRVMCFGEARNPAFVVSTPVKRAKVAPGATRARP